MYYAITTFGCPSVSTSKITRDIDQAIRTANRAKGSGSCTAARVYECDSRKLAASVDISEIRQGERIVYSA